jgi:hypothetical protein
MAMKRRKPGTRNHRGVRHRDRARPGCVATRTEAGWALAEEPGGDETASGEYLDSLLPLVTQVPALAARRRIEQRREEQWLHEALDDFADN